MLTLYTCFDWSSLKDDMNEVKLLQFVPSIHSRRNKFYDWIPRSTMLSCFKLESLLIIQLKEFKSLVQLCIICVFFMEKCHFCAFDFTQTCILSVKNGQIMYNYVKVRAKRKWRLIYRTKSSCWMPYNPHELL